MKRIIIGMIGLASLTASTLPAFAGGDWDDEEYIYSRHWRDYRSYYRAPAYRVPAYEVYIPYGAYFVDEPDFSGPDCEIERKWRRGYYRERIACDDD